MGIVKRLLGICETKPPRNSGSWDFQSGKLTLDLARLPELQSAGAAVRLEGASLPERVLVVRGEDERLYAFRNRCAHAGRRLDAVGGDRVQCCSVGKSLFDLQGERHGGSAKKAIHTYAVEQDGEKAVITLD